MIVKNSAVALCLWIRLWKELSRRRKISAVCANASVNAKISEVSEFRL